MIGTAKARRGSAVIKRSMLIAGHSTSISLEDAFWDGLRSIADERRMATAELVAEIDSLRQAANLSSAVRVFVLDHYRFGRSSEPRRPA